MTTQTVVKPSQTVPTSVERTRNGRTYLPAVDIYETEEELVLLADLPGVKGEDIDIQFEQGELTITGKVEERQRESTSYVLQEYGIGDFVRSFKISEIIDSSRISAEHKDGVLKLHLPKVETAKPRKITVKSK